MAAVTETRRRLSLPTERVFYLTMSIALFATVFAGFARSFYLHFLFPAFPRPPETIFYIKGLIFTAWCVLLVVQASLILADRRALHRKLGVAGVGVAIAMVVTGVYGTLVAAARMPGGPVAVMPLSFLIIPLTDMVLFAILVAFGVVHRSSPQTHKRIMLIATIGLIVAGVTRLGGRLGRVAGPDRCLGSRLARPPASRHAWRGRRAGCDAGLAPRHRKLAAVAGILPLGGRPRSLRLPHVDAAGQRPIAGWGRDPAHVLISSGVRVST